MSNIEQTLSIIKPDAVERNLQDEIQNELKKNGFIIFKEKKIQISKQEAEQLQQIMERFLHQFLCQLALLAL